MKEIKEKESKILGKDEVSENFKNSIPFPYGYNRLEKYGFNEADIMEIRQILLDEEKEFNELSKNRQHKV